MIKDIISIKDKVAYLLENYPATRDSDKMLWLAFMTIFRGLKGYFDKEFGYPSFRGLILSEKTPTFESLSRVRRKFQESGQWVGTKRKEKMEEEREVRRYYGSDWPIDRHCDD